MSAICGIYALNNAPLNLDALNSMIGALAAHGPDGHDQWHDGSVALGHQMMHITPESSDETLPLHHSARGITLTADARLDNRDELKRAMGSEASRLQTDSSLILSAYQKWGISCVDRFVGEFNIAIWDAKKRHLQCITDPMGIRPLYYRKLENGCFAFASEIRPLLNIAKSSPINQRRIALLGVSALTGFLETTRTGFEDIYRIPAATVLTVSGSGIQTSEYWRPDPNKRLHFKSDEECAEAFREVFFESITARLRSAKPVGALLSGGLDSSAIVGAASRILNGENKSLVTLSSLPEPTAQGQVTDEAAYIDLCRGYNNLQMIDVRAIGHGPFDNVEELVKTGSLGSYGFQHYMYTALVGAGRKQGVRLLLDGYGGELSASAYVRGYFSELLLRGKLGTLFKELKALSTDGRIRANSVKRNVLRPLVPFRILQAMNRHEKFESMVEYPVRKEFIRDVLGNDLEDINDQLLKLLIQAPDHRRNMVQSIFLARQDLRQRSHAGFMGYADMQFTYPYLDKRVLEFTLAIDGKFKLESGRDRRLIRMASRDLVPDTVRQRTSKAAFCPDYHLRYSKQIAGAADKIKELSQNADLSKVIDFQMLSSAVGHQHDYDPKKPMDVDYDSQFLVPNGMFMCYFLRDFTASETHNCPK